LTGKIPLSHRLAAGETILLDGATGTELDRRGVRTTLPLWSALGLIEAPEVVRAIHEDYARAGADVLIANTFRTTRRTLAKAGRPVDEAAVLTNLAVELARSATAFRPGALVAGSIAPLEDCYSPWLSPPFGVALAEHRAQARLLADAGVDFLMVETMPCATEAEAALIAAGEAGLETTIGFVLGNDRRLLSGETLTAAVGRAMAHAPAAILINCSPSRVVDLALGELRALTSLPIGGYANLGVAEATVGWEADDSVDGSAYAALAAPWLKRGARIVGGCCGTRPEHIAALRALLDRRGDGFIP
jgi:S-methylmethionine-dependent homocysteine/selenocysteine methylase